MKTIKFRAWNAERSCFLHPEEFKMNGLGKVVWIFNPEGIEDDCILMQYTGLHDKNGLQEVYEGDIIDEYGNIKGNIYEMDKGETDLVIEGLGTSAWSKTEKAGLELGLKYAK